MKVNKKLNHLAEFQNSNQPLVSIYIPTHKAGQVMEDRIRFKNALSEAEQQLLSDQVFPENNLDKKDVRKMLSPAMELLIKDDFWLHLSDGLAVFIGPDVFEYFVVPEHFHSFVYVGQEFYLRHLLPLVTDQQRFFLLALSQGDVRFFECEKHHITPVRIEDLVPESIEESMTEQEASVYARSGSHGQAIFHGQGGGKEDKLIEIEKYFRQIDQGLMQMLHDEQAPLLIASVDYLVPIYRKISNYPHLVDFHISGNPDDDDPVLLHEKASLAMKETFQKEREEKKENFAQALAHQKASLSLTHNVVAAKEGRIDTLFIDKDTPFVWGQHCTDRTVDLHFKQNHHNNCLLNYTAMQTWKNGGTVYNVPREEFPNMVSNVNAIYRY